ncbi:DNA-binding protein WhiA [Bifidobacterium felsineum]|uniref:DNA-binding protein WhiA n=1 Tax=Bifidobacterium felsineum TaxID=2045440 RepID=UPI001BDDA786|nr:DNA-binding protein WhiA [Bifidobacterium felsineum]MBT1164407.1 DNA-binding protein WhiA [Bifidobacterium felsineum]
MALLDDVKSELAAFEGDSPAAIKAQAATMIRFGGGLHRVQNAYVIRSIYTSLEAAEWLRDTLRNVFGHEAEIKHQTRQTQNGPVETYIVLVTRNVVALALQTGLVDRRKQQVHGLPAEVVNGSIAQIKASWRGAFMARGMLSEPGKASFLDIACPSEEAAMALCGMARRLGFQAKHRTTRTSERVTLKDPDAIERMLKSMGASRSVREWTGKRSDGETRGKANRLANFDDANMRRSAKAAAEASEKVQRAFEILGDNIPENLRQAGQLRIDHVDKSLEELGKIAEPQITKDAIAGRIRRLLQLAEKTEKARAAESK